MVDYQEIKLSVNGQMHSIRLNPAWTLLHVLREELGLTGTKNGCGEGECGMCTIIMNGKAVDSCMVLALEADGAEIITIEGLARDGKLHPLQKAFINMDAIQCGCCTPGMILSAKALLDEYPDPTDEQIRHGMSGNICRCTGYVKIKEAIISASQNI